MTPAGLEDCLRRALRQASPHLAPDEVWRAHRRLVARLERRRTVTRSLATVGVLVATVVAALGVFVLPGRAAAPADVAGATERAAVDGDPAPSPGIVAGSDAPVLGDPVPAEVRGRWTAVVRSEGTSVQATLTLDVGTYELCTGPGACLTGRVVRQDEDLVFFEERWCGAAGSSGAGRYAWSLLGARLRLSPTGTDPCYRAPTLGEAAWTRA